MPRVVNPNAVASSLPGRMAAIKAVTADIKGKARSVFNSLTIGAGGLIVTGVTQLVGGITGGLAVTGSIGTTVDLNAVGSVNASGNANITGTLTAATGMNSTGVYNTAVNVGSFRTVSVNISGQLGETVSSRRFKQDIEPAPSLHDGLMTVGTFLFRYINDVEANGENAQVHLGGMAEDFHAAGLHYLIDYEADGVTPHGIKYERLALALIPTVQAQQKRIEDLEGRMQAAGL